MVFPPQAHRAWPEETPHRGQGGVLLPVTSAQEDSDPMSRWTLGWLLGTVAVTLVGLSILQSAPSRDSTLQGKYENVKLLVDVLEEVQHKYVKELSKEQMRELVENMINSGLERLDPHSSFINAEEYKQFMKQSKGSFGGVGISIGLNRAGQIVVDSPMPGRPAYEAGVMAGDIILKIDGKSTEGMSLKKAVELIQGEPGHKVALTVLHLNSKAPVELTMTRAMIRVDSVLGDQRMQQHLEDWDFTIDRVNRIAYIRVTQFTETTVPDLIKVVEQLQRDKIRGLVLDLRNNPGGLLKSAVEVSSMFLPEGKRIVTTKGRNQKEEVYESRRLPNSTGPVTTIPMVVLLNRYSASASEIVAAALQDHARAVVVGERSYGKGSVQNIIPMENGASALKLTTASYWRPSNKNIHRFPESKEEDEWGVHPNPGFKVDLSDDERIDYYKWRRERDRVRPPGEPSPKAGLNPAVPILGSWPLVNGNAQAEDAPRKDFRDRVLDTALEHLRKQLNRNAAAPVLPQDNREASRPSLPQLEPIAGSTGRAALSFRSEDVLIGREELR
jgi:carboxyl-terminal processing protease